MYRFFYEYCKLVSITILINQQAIGVERAFKKNTGKKLQLLRIEKQLTQEEMAEKLHLSTSAYCKIEYGDTDLTLTRLNRIAQIFDLSPFKLFRLICENTLSENSCMQTVSDDHSPHNIQNEEFNSLLKSHTLIIESLDKRITELERKLQL